jgi:excinuclease ABC subunit C
VSVLEIKKNIEGILKSLPESPGVYQYFDLEGKILYVGKAKNLKKRVGSYFYREQESARLRLLVKKIEDIKTINVQTEMDALLLENNLIKSLQPRYNVNLKDDKTFPWICVKNERFPRVFSTRQRIKDGSDYFGPYASVLLLRTLLDLIRQLYPLRTCSFELSKENIQKKKFRECLDFHIGKCKAPCTAKQNEEDYLKNISEIKSLLKGNVASLVKDLKEKMNSHSENLEFEQAMAIKDKLFHLEKFQSKSTIVSNSIHDVDVFSLVADEDSCFVNYFKVMNGSIVMGQTLELKKKLNETDAEMLLFAIHELRTRYQSLSEEIIIPFELQFEYPNVKFTIPKIGEKKQLLDLSYKNAFLYKKEKEKQQAILDPENHKNRIMAQMKKDLRMQEEPRRIECFDNSNIQGAFPVSAMTVFIGGKPAKSEYRHFNIKTVEGPNDFASMEEVIYRRYKRLIDEKLELPQLIVIDGGKGQLSSAINSLDALGLVGKITIIGIAKKLEEIYFPGDSVPLYLDKRSETLRVIQQIRDEAHRFGITHHRSKRSRETFRTELSDIKGISEQSVKKLLTQFASVKQIKEATEEEISSVVGKAKALLIKNYFSKQPN